MARLRMLTFSTRLPARKTVEDLEALMDSTYAALTAHEQQFGVDAAADLDTRTVQYTLLIKPGISEWDAKQSASRTLADMKTEKNITSFSEVP